MPAVDQHITHWAGDSAVISIPVKDKDGNAVNLDGASVHWWMGKNVNATGDDVYVKKAIDDGLTLDHDTSGLYTVSITLDPEDTEDVTPGTFYHECEVIDSGGNVSTVTIGKFILKPTLIPNEP